MNGIFLEGITADQLESMIEKAVQKAISQIPRNSPSKLLTYREVESRFGIKRHRLYQLHEAGALFYVKEGRRSKWRESDVQSYANQLKSAG